MAGFQLPKEARILTKPGYDQVFSRVDKKKSGRYFLLLTQNNDLARPRLGLIIGKKHAKRAVDRNRIKRLARESFRQHQPHLAGFDILLLPKHANTRLASNANLLKDLELLWPHFFRASPNKAKNESA